MLVTDMKHLSDYRMRNIEVSIDNNRKKMNYVGEGSRIASGVNCGFGALRD